MEVSTMSQRRRHHSSQEKVAILKRHLLEQTPVSDLCDEFGLSPTLFYRWQKEFFENAHRAFNTDRATKAHQQAQDHLIARLHDKLQRKNEVLAKAPPAASRR
jgi:transposase-like protein